MRTFKPFACTFLCAATMAFAKEGLIYNPLPESSTIQFIAPSAKTVHKGEVLVVLDITPIFGKWRAADEAFQAAEAELKASQEKIAPLEAANAAALAAAADEIVQAERALKRYIEGDAPANELILKLNVIDAKGALERQRQRFSTRDKLLASGAIPKTQYDALDVDLTKAKYAMDIAQLKLDVFEKYEKLQVSDQFTNQLAQKKKSLPALQAQCASNLNAAQTAVQAAKDKVKSLGAERERLGQLLEKTAVYAPEDGSFFRSDASQSGGAKIEIGSTLTAGTLMGFIKKP